MSIQIQQVARQDQRIILSPRMQQAIHLLQVSTQELQALIQKELVQNPLLEEIQLAPPAPVSGESASPSESPSGPGEEWDRSSRSLGSGSARSSDDKEKEAFLESLITRPETLSEHLLQQLEITVLSPEDKEVGKIIIGNLDENGYLADSIANIARAAHVEPERAEEVLKMIQTLDPPGVGARDLRECLLVQMEALGMDDPQVREIVDKHLDKLAGKKYSLLARVLKTAPARIQKAAEAIMSLEPKPGRIFNSDQPQYIAPDITLVKKESGYQVVFNREYLPRLRVNRRYQELLNDAQTPPETIEYIRQKMKGAQWFISNIQQREETLRKIMDVIVTRQQGFLEKGIGNFVPMKMADVAQEVGVHESTVSRAVANKYVHTSQGVFPLKFFFSTALSTPAGKDDVSARNVKNLVAEMIGKEDPRRPLSDQEIVGVLAERGIRLSRRTVAKYRLEMKIAPSHLRKKC